MNAEIAPAPLDRQVYARSIGKLIDRKPRAEYRILTSILVIEKVGRKATSIEIKKIVKEKTTATIAHLLDYYWEKGWVSKHMIKTKGKIEMYSKT